MKNSRLRIYIAEDNPQYLELLAHRVRNAEREVTCFKHTASLLVSLALRPDVVLLDHQFGQHAEGLETLKRIKKVDPSIHVILISGQQDAEVAVEAIKAGATDYLEKNGQELEALDQCLTRIFEEQKGNKRKFRLGKLDRPASLGNAALWLALLLLFATSCTPQKHVLQPRKGKQAELPPALTHHKPHLIVPDDKVSLSIWNNDDMSVGSIFGIYNSNEVYGKWILVNEAGDLSLPLIGKVHMAGKTTTEAAELLQAEYGKEIKDPVIVVRVLNREATVTGEVKEPGNFILDKEKNTLSEVLGKAEGFTDYAKLKKATLTRRSRGRTRTYELNLKKMSSHDLSRILVRRGDVIHIPERAGKRVERKMPLLIPIASLATSVGILFSVTRKND